MKKLMGVMAVAALLVESGCLYSDPVMRPAIIDLRNVSTETVSVDLLRVGSEGSSHLRADLAPGGSYVQDSSHSKEVVQYVEARLRLASQTEDGPYYLEPLPMKYEVRRDVEVKDGRVRLSERDVRGVSN